MKSFNFTEQTAERIQDIRKRIKVDNSDSVAITTYSKILDDTQIAIDNIDDCVNDINELRKVYVNFSKGDTSCLDALLGLNPHGNNGSHYRDFLSLDEKFVIGVRISDHYETKKTALDKSNNKVQYLYQVVLVQSPPKPKSNDAIETNQRVGNTFILTQGIVGADYNDVVLKEMLLKISDYLMCPDYVYESKQLMISVSQLRRKVKHKKPLFCGF